MGLDPARAWLGRLRRDLDWMWGLRGLRPRVLWHYLDLVGPDVRERIELVVAPGCTGPRDQQPVDLLYIDSSHTRGHTVAEVRAWQPYLQPGAPVLFDDYTHPDYPGVRDAIEELGLEGKLRGKLFIYNTRT